MKQIAYHFYQVQHWQYLYKQHKDTACNTVILQQHNKQIVHGISSNREPLLDK
jgi:hypothetical protein